MMKLHDSMASTPVAEPAGDLGSKQCQLATALQKAFGSCFVLRHTTDDERCVQHAANVPGYLAEILGEMVESAAARLQPQAVATDSGACLLAVPLESLGAPGVVASAVFDSASPDLLLRHAKLFLRTSELEEENDQLINAQEALTIQVSQDFEELMFLRGAADHLRLHAHSRDPLDMARAVVPMLRETLKVETVALVHSQSGMDDSSQTTNTEPRVLWSGQVPLSDPRCLELVDVIRDRATNRPFIQNEVCSSHFAARFPEIREFLTVKVGNDERVGWLIAINRATDEYDAQYAWRAAEQHFGTVEASLLTSAASILATDFHNVELLREGETLFTEIIKALVNAIEARDPYTCGHSERVARFCRRLGQEHGLDAETCENLHLSGLLHDVGKIAISDTVLRKPGNLTDEEFAELKKHPDEGLAILRDLSHLRHVLPGVVHHHERFDGRGYPHGLSGDSIPLEGRIMAICDAFDAMTSDRPYRQAMPQEKSESILREGAGSQWDADLVQKFLSIMPDIIRIRDAYRPGDGDRMRGSSES